MCGAFCRFPASRVHWVANHRAVWPLFGTAAWRLVVVALIVASVFQSLLLGRARAVSLEWVRQLGGATNDVGWGVSADRLGNVYLTGYTFNDLGGPNAGAADAFLSKYSAAGVLQWTRQLGTLRYDISTSVSADNQGNIYISGHTERDLGGTNPNQGLNDAPDAFVSKYDAVGVLQWTRQLGTAANEFSMGVSTDGLGNLYISGHTFGSLAGPNAGESDIFISKYDALGTHQWTRQFGTAAADMSGGISADDLGNVYVTGYTQGSLGGPNAGDYDAFLVKYDSAGVVQWTRQLGTELSDHSRGVSADDLGNVFISGNTAGSLDGTNAGDYDAFVAKYDAAGVLMWIRQLGTTGNENGAAIDNGGGVSADGLGNVYISGSTEGDLGGTNAGLIDAFVSKYNSAGGLLWTKQLGTAAKENWYGWDVSADGLGNVYISGDTYGSLGGPNAGDADAYLAKYSIEPLTGDYNRDGTVDGRDYVVWRSNVGNVVPPCTGGDANCNGFVEWVDYGPWRENYGRTVEDSVAGANVGNSASVPEPTPYVLFGWSVGALMGRGLHPRRICRTSQRA